MRLTLKGYCFGGKYVSAVMLFAICLQGLHNYINHGAFYRA